MLSTTFALEEDTMTEWMPHGAGRPATLQASEGTIVSSDLKLPGPQGLQPALAGH